jgi:uncharacterized protein YecT (DUF1311 family)
MSVGVRFSVLVVAAVFWPTAAQALDCSKTTTSVEKAVCADAALKDLDDAIAAAYEAARGASQGHEREYLADSQRKWLKLREDMCGWEEDAAKLAACVRERTDTRRKFLAGEPMSGTDTGSRMVPAFVQQDGTKKQYDVDFSLMHFAAPATKGEKRFNGEIDKIAKSARLGPHGEDMNIDVPLASSANATVNYASPRLISAAINVYSYDGGAHGNGGTSNLNIALEAGRMLKSDDIFPAPAIAALKEDCQAQAFDQKREKFGGEFEPEADSNFSEDAIMAKMKDFEGWSFFADNAVVTFNPYEIGSFAEGGYTCEFPIAKLKTLAKPGAPLPE